MVVGLVMAENLSTALRAIEISTFARLTARGRAHAIFWLCILQAPLAAFLIAWLAGFGDGRGRKSAVCHHSPSNIS